MHHVTNAHRVAPAVVICDDKRAVGSQFDGIPDDLDASRHLGAHPSAQRCRVGSQLIKHARSVSQPRRQFAEQSGQQPVAVGRTTALDHRRGTKAATDRQDVDPHTDDHARRRPRHELGEHARQLPRCGARFDNKVVGPLRHHRLGALLIGGGPRRGPDRPRHPGGIGLRDRDPETHEQATAGVVVPPPVEATPARGLVVGDENRSAGRAGAGLVDKIGVRRPRCDDMGQRAGTDARRELGAAGKKASCGCRTRVGHSANH